MVSFVSLFIGLVLGYQTIEVAVNPAVSHVELRLDDQRIGVLRPPTWSIQYDFGSELRPRKLAAIAFGQDGRPLAEVRQLLNLPRAEAEVGVVLEGGRSGAPERVRLAWESLVGSEPRSVRASVDGRPLVVGDPHSIELPPLDPDRLHYLRVELEFSAAVSTVVERVFGGTYAEEVTSELTALPMLLTHGTALPTVEAMQGWLTKEGKPLEIAAIERGRAEIVVVRDEGSLEAFDGLQRDLAHTLRGILGNLSSVSGGDAALSESARVARDAMPLRPDQRLRFLTPFAEAQKGTSLSYALFPSSPDFSSRDAGVFWLLARARPQRSFKTPQRLADAVAVAGMSAAGTGRRRAVVLVLGRDPADESQVPPAESRRYLETLQVPFRVWALDPRRGASRATWGEVTDVSSAGKLDTAVQELFKMLDRQVVVWLRGSHLPQEIAVAQGAPIEPAR